MEQVQLLLSALLKVSFKEAFFITFRSVYKRFRGFR